MSYPTFLYHGPINTRAKAMALAKKLREENGSQKAIDAAKMLERNWHSIASRPAIQPEIIAMVNTTPLYRKNSIVNRIINGK